MRPGLPMAPCLCALSMMLGSRRPCKHPLRMEACIGAHTPMLRKSSPLHASSNVVKPDSMPGVRRRRRRARSLSCRS